MASGDVQVGYVGSSPFAAAASRGLDIKAVYVPSISGTDEALVVRDGAGIGTPADLRGKRLSAAPVSTNHYQLPATLKQNGIAEQDAKVLALAQPEIVAAWKRGDLDRSFVWDPALSDLKKNGKMLLTSKQVAENGVPTFNAWLTSASFEKSDPDFLKAFASEIARQNASFLTDKVAWSEDSANVKAIAHLFGGTTKDQGRRPQGPEPSAGRGDLQKLLPDWWSLWSRVPSATPFVSPAWLLPWWRTFRPGMPSTRAFAFAACFPPISAATKMMAVTAPGSSTWPRSSSLKARAGLGRGRRGRGGPARR